LAEGTSAASIGVSLMRSITVIRASSSFGAKARNPDKPFPKLVAALMSFYSEVI